MKKTIIFITLMIMMCTLATAFQPHSNTTIGGKYSEYVPTFLIEETTRADSFLGEGNSGFDRNMKVTIPYFITNPFTNEKVADNNTLFAISIAYDNTINAVTPCNNTFTDTLNDRIWIIDSQGDNWYYNLNATSEWANDRAVIYYFEAENFLAEIDSYQEELIVRTSYETFCPTYKIWGFRKLSWTEVEIANEENRAQDVHTTANTIFEYAINIIILNYKLWLIAYWIIMILSLIGAITLFFGIPMLFVKYIKRL